MGGRLRGASASRKNPRDDDNPLLTHLRIYDELLPWLDELAYGPQDQRRIDTVHRQVLGSVVEFIPWRLFHATWSSWVEPNDRGGAAFFPSVPLSPLLSTVSKEHLELYAFHTGAGLDFVLASVDAGGLSIRLERVSSRRSCVGSPTKTRRR